MLQQPMHPLPLQLIQQQNSTSQPLPTPAHIQIQSPPSKQQVNFHQPPILSPPGSSVSPSSGSNMSLQGPNSSHPLGNLHSNGVAVNDEDQKIKDKCLYLKQLLQDKKQIQSLNGLFLHADRILDEGEIYKLLHRSNSF